MIKVVSYKDLVLNTMLDTIRRERRYTIDNRDIMNYEGVISEIIKYNELDITLGVLTNGREFMKEMDKYTYLSECGGNQVYTLLPWISEEELEDVVKNTIFPPQDMKRITEVTKDYLRFSRDNFELYNLRKIESRVNYSAKENIEKSIKSLECSLSSEKQKLQKVKKKMKIGE